MTPPVVIVMTPTASADAGVPDAAPLAPEPPKLACEDGTGAVPAPFPDPTWFCARGDGTKHGAFITLFPDLSIEIEGSYKNGKLDGAWKRHHPGGAVAEEGAFAAGLPTGTWRQLDVLGNVLGEYTLAAGTGRQKKWLDDGPLYSEITLKKGVPHGPARIFDRPVAPGDRTGQVVVTAKFYLGKLDGDHVVGTKNNLRIEETFSRGTRRGARTIWQFWSLLIEEAYDARGKLDGSFTIWRERNLRRVQGQYSHGKRVGAWVWTDRKNNKEREGDFVDGKKTGLWSEYDQGKLTFQGMFTDGKPDGEFVYYDKRGVELGRFTISDGTGTMLTFHPNKKPASRTKIYKGELSGKYEELTTLGKVVVEGNYAGDRKHGLWREWTDAGVLLLEEQYKRGKLDGAFRKFVDGKVAVEATYKDGKAEGTYTEYRDGKPSLTGQFTADRRTGTWTSYDASGAVALTATYKDGVLDGAWRQISDGVTVDGTMVAGRRSGTWTRTDRAGTVSSTIVKTP